jgi:polyhydroxybutyrate depolymerase
MIEQLTPRAGTPSRHRVAALGGAVLLATVLAQTSPPAGAASRPSRGTDRTGQLGFGGRTRTYLVHRPSAARAGSPVLLVFHGGGGTAAGMARITHLNQIADRHAFVVVYPQGVENSWAGGLGGTPADQAGVDDVGFVRALIDQLARSDRVDTTRVFATGLSSGGFMAHRLGCDLSDRIAGIAPVAATLPSAVAPICAPPHPMPVLEMHGTLDPLVPFGGGHVRGRGPGGRQALSAPDTTAHWAHVNGCPSPPHTATLPSTAPDQTQIRTDTYGPCPAGSVVLFTIEGGGHTWPGGEQYLPVAVVGRTTRQLDAGETMWRFFAGLPRRA